MMLAKSKLQDQAYFSRYTRDLETWTLTQALKVTCSDRAIFFSPSVQPIHTATSERPAYI